MSSRIATAMIVAMATPPRWLIGSTAAIGCAIFPANCSACRSTSATQHDRHEEHQAAHEGRLQERFDRVHGSSAGSEIPVYTEAPSRRPRSLTMTARRRGNPFATRPRVAIVGANFGGPASGPGARIRVRRDRVRSVAVVRMAAEHSRTRLAGQAAGRPAAAAQAARGRGGPSLRARRRRRHRCEARNPDDGRRRGPRIRFLHRRRGWRQRDLWSARRGAPRHAIQECRTMRRDRSPAGGTVEGAQAAIDRHRRRRLCRRRGAR